MPQNLAPVRLKRRSDFLRVAKGERIYSSSFTLQAGRIALPASEANSSEADFPPDSISTTPLPAVARFGITVTKRIGRAVQRNRIRRRLKEALRLSQDLSAKPGRDYVIVAKTEALTARFQSLQAELVAALRKSDRPAQKRSASRKPGNPKSAGGQKMPDTPL
jgi:ribonuclease P protein component